MEEIIGCVSSDQLLERQTRNQHDDCGYEAVPRRAVCVSHNIATHSEHATLTLRAANRLASHSTTNVPCAHHWHHTIPVDLERAERCIVAAVCQCSGGDGTSWTTVTRPPSGDGSDVEHDELAAQGVLAARIGNTGTAGT